MANFRPGMNGHEYYAKTQNPGFLKQWVAPPDVCLFVLEKAHV